MAWAAVGRLVVSLFRNPAVQYFLVDQVGNYLRPDELRGANVAGASGAGKSTLVDALNRVPGQMAFDFDETRARLYDQEGLGQDAFDAWRKDHPQHPQWQRIESILRDEQREQRDLGGTTLQWGPLPEGEVPAHKNFLLMRDRDEVLRYLFAYYKNKRGVDLAAAGLKPEHKLLSNLDMAKLPNRVSGAVGWYNMYDAVWGQKYSHRVITAVPVPDQKSPVKRKKESAK